MEIQSVPEHSGNRGNELIKSQANITHQANRSITLQWPYNSTLNWTRWISEEPSPAKPQWEADRYSTHFRYRLKGKACSNSLIPMASANLLATRFYRIKYGDVPTGDDLQWFGHQEDDKCWWYGERVAQTQEHLLSHGSWWQYQPKVLWKEVWKATCWKAGQCQRTEVLQQFSTEICDKAVMDFLAVTDLGQFLPGWGMKAGEASRLEYTTLYYCALHFFSFSVKTKDSRWRFNHLTGSPGGGEDKALSYSGISKCSMNKHQQ